VTLRSVIAYTATFSILALIVFAAGVQPSALTPVAFILTGAAWLSFLVLGRAATRRPRIGALTERAFIALVVASLGTVSCLIVLNTDNGHAFFTTEVASLLFRLAIIAVLAVPALWLVLWLTGRLGQTDRP
jgi:hypothetical protein